MNWLVVVVLGAAGVAARYAVDSWVASLNPSLPFGTLLINIVGCFLAGFVFSAGAHRKPASDLTRLGVIVGFCGGFTTFSGFGLQTIQLLSSGRTITALAYGIVTPVACVTATALGYYCGRMVPAAG